jgi:hypothetical protein
MKTRVVQFLAILLCGLALVPGGAHLLELANKLPLDRDAYMTVQQIYRGWAFAGLVQVAAIAATLWLTLRSRSQTVPMRLASTGFALLLLALASFFVWVNPANSATGQWTVAPANLEHLRVQWEYGHAASAILTLLAFAATTAASLLWKEI